jgi:hypothetical protein
MEVAEKLGRQLAGTKQDSDDVGSPTVPVHGRGHNNDPGGQTM